MAAKAQTAFEKFRLLTKKLVSVSKDEADKVQRRAQRGKSRRGA